MPFNLDWSSVGANGIYALANGADTIDLTIATTTNASGATATSSFAGTPSAAGLWVNAVSEPITSTLTFSAPVTNFSFEIYDIDSSVDAWDDQLTVLVTDAQGKVQSVNFGDLLADPYHSSTGVVLNADGSASAGVETTAAQDSVMVSIAGPVSKIQFIFDNGESYATSGMFGVGNVTFDRAALDYVVAGTEYDDVIDDAYVLDPEGDRVDANDAANGSNDDVVQADAGNDSVDAGLGDDSVVGGAGNDTLNGQEGNDTLVGDDEIDADFSVRGNSIAGLGGDDLIYGGLGNDSIFGGSGSDSLYGGDGDDSLLGGHGDDFLEGGAGNDDLEGLYGDDTIHGGDGNDHVFGRDGADLIYGGDGADTLVGSIGIDTIYGGAGNDILAGSQGSDLIYGGIGDDLVYIGVPAPGDIAYDSEGTIYLDEGNDFLDASDATLKFDAYGGEGNDYMNAGVGDDTLFGGTGADTLTGGDGADHMIGGDDRDLIFGGGGDVIDGGEGGDDFDTLSLANLGRAAMTNVIYGGGDNEAGTVEVLDGTGAVIGSFTFSNIETVIPCFTPDTIILTNTGEKRVDALAVGDKVLTRDNGYQTIRWIGARTLSSHDLAAQPSLNPVCIRAGALGTGLPERDMTVSPQHRMLIAGSHAQMLFGVAEVLVAAIHLVNDSSIMRVWPQTVTYIHLLFDRHEIIRGDGAWTESFQPGEQTLQGMQSPQRDELLALFPNLTQGKSYSSARLTLKSFEAKVLLKM